MAKKKKGFGNSLEEVDSNIANLEAERKAIADRINAGEKISSKENKRFSQLDAELESANRSRSSFVPDTSAPGTDSVNVDYKEVISDPTAPVGASGQPSPLLDPNANMVGPMNDPNALNNDILGTQPVMPDPSGMNIQTPADQQANALSEFLNNNQPSGQGTVEDAINQAAGTKVGQSQPSVGNLPQIMTSQQQLNIPGNNQILKGTVSGQIIGNQPIFVEGGGITPMAVLNNRRVAQQQAVLAKKAAQQELLNAKPPQLKDARFQRGFNELFTSNQDRFVKAAQEQYGDNWVEALKDQNTEIGRAYVNSLSNFDFLARIGDQSTDRIAEVKAGIDSGDMVYSPQTLQMLNDYEALEGDFASGNVGGLISLENAYNQLEGGIALDKLLNDQNIDVKGTVTQYASIAENNDAWTTTTQKKTAYENQLRQLAKDLAENQMAPSVARGITSGDQIFEHLNALYGYENIIDKKITTKPSGGGGSTIVVNTSDVQGEPIEEKVDGINYTAYHTQEVPTDIKSVSATGLKVYKPDGTMETVDGVRNVDFVSLQLVKVIDPNDPKNFTWKEVAVGTHEDTDPLGRKTTETKLYDMEELGSRLLTDGVIDQENLDNLNSTFDSIKKKNSIPQLEEEGR